MPKANPTAKRPARTVLKQSDVIGYTEVEIKLMPEAQQDENANAQRAGLLKDTMPQEYIDREVLRVKSPDQVNQWRKEQMALQNPEWAKFKSVDDINQLLEADKKLYERWVESKATELKPEWVQLFQEMLAQGIRPLDAWGMVGQLMAGGQVQVPQQGQPLQQQSPMLNNAGGLQPDMQGVPPQMTPPAMMGQVPVPPDQAAMQASFNPNGGGG